MIDVLKYRWLSAVLSLTIAVSFVVTYFYKERMYGQAFSYSVDFTGGTEVLFKFDTEISANAVKDVLTAAGWPGAVTREFSKDEIIVRVKDYSNDSKGLAERMRVALETGLQKKVSVLRNEYVGAGVGDELRWKSFLAIIYSMVAILLYVAFRFRSFAFAAGAVVALIHDAVVVLAVFLFLGREISVNVIGAILAVLGYSMNDTIVIFSQIREELRKSGKTASLYDIITSSINHTLRRTLLTSFATTLTVVSMLVLGGEALRDFSLALLVGIVFGTYSSIYIASPVMSLLYKKD